MKRPSALSILVGSILLALTPPVLAQGVLIIPNGGISKDMRSETSNRWNMGFNLGVSILAPISEGVSFGGRIAYHHWEIDGEGWRQDLFSSRYNKLESSSGSQDVFEILPVVRFAFSTEKTDVNVSGQLGVGLFVVAPSDVKLRASYSVTTPTGSEWGWTEEHIFGSTGVGFGGQVGLPIVISETVELMPLYSLYVWDGSPYHHFAVNVGILIKP